MRKSISEIHHYKFDQKRYNQTGNALVYVLIAIALIGILTVTMTRQGDQADGQGIDDDLVNLYSLDLLEYAQTAQSVIDQMGMTGTSYAEFVFLNPGIGGFHTGPHIHKVFHVQGGGLNYKDRTDFQPGTFISTGSWQFSNATNVQWTPSASSDLIFTAIGIEESLCADINEKITGSNTIPTASVTANTLFAAGSSTDFTTTNCAACNGYPSLCVEGSGGVYAFYNIMIGR